MEMEHRPSPSLRQFGRNSFQYSLLLTSVLSAKLLHLYSHATSLPILLYLLYMPTFLALDLLNALIFWIVIHISTHGRWNILLAMAKCTFCLIILGASSVQIAFFMETGGEIKWKAARSLASDPDGFKVALTGGVQAIFVSILLVAVAFAISRPLYNFTRNILSTGIRAFGGSSIIRLFESTRGTNVDETIRPTNFLGESSDSDDDICMTTRHSVEAAPLLIDIEAERPSTNPWIMRLVFLAPVIAVCFLLSVRPAHFPYSHMSASLPFTLAELWNPFDTDICEAGHFEDFPHFPLGDTLSEEFWEPSTEGHVGWRPIVNMTIDYQIENHVKRPSWLPERPIQGLERWYLPPREEYVEVTSKGRISRPRPGSPPHDPSYHTGPPPHGSDHHHPGGPPRPHRPHRRPQRFKGFNYNPITDPMRISNLDQGVVSPISDALGERDIKIKHIVLLALESTRKDVFPFKKGSRLANLIMSTHSQGESASTAYEELSKLTTTAEILTGEKSGFEAVSNGTVKSGAWRSLTRDRGGLNIQGGMTGSTTSLKSMLESHCGVQPLAVDFTVEAGRRIYQPCLPSILGLFNSNKPVESSDDSSRATSREFVDMPWKSLYVQAITDQFDHQDMINDQVGFDEIVVKRTLVDPNSSHYPPTEKQSNYFGFPETQVKPYIEDAIRQAKENGERLFLSHLTSTTHHPWNLPDGSESIQYLKQGRWKKEHELNRYLNTIRYVDNWIGEIMDLLEKTEIAEETLVVMVGDHGMAFEEDSPVHTTYENGHISNMRVPLNFYHPSLPRMQLEINATSLSIIPTILDLLVTTSSLDKQDKAIASELMQEYEGQSLIRPYLTEKNGRHAWNVAVLNAGGAVLSVSSAAVPFRLVMPICKAGAYRFTSNDIDPHELQPVEGNHVAELAKKVARLHSVEAGKWLEQAEQIGRYWVLEQRRRWRYNGASLQDDRRPEELLGAGAEKKQHWWDT